MDTRSFLGGLICGEGCFSFYMNKKNNFPEFRFTITMHIRDTELLELLRDQIGEGKIKIYKGRPTMARYEILSHKSNVEKIIPYFEPVLLGYKKKQFEQWKIALLDHYAGREERRKIASSKSWKNHQFKRCA